MVTKPKSEKEPKKKQTGARVPGDDDVTLHADFDELPPSLARAFGVRKKR